MDASDSGWKGTLFLRLVPNWAARFQSGRHRKNKRKIRTNDGAERMRAALLPGTISVAVADVKTPKFHKRKPVIAQPLETESWPKIVLRFSEENGFQL